MLQMKLCPTCHKNQIMGDERMCPECRAQSANHESMVRENDRTAYNDYMRGYQKKRYEQLKRLGICTICKERPTVWTI